MLVVRRGCVLTCSHHARYDCTRRQSNDPVSRHTKRGHRLASRRDKPSHQQNRTQQTGRKPRIPALTRTKARPKNKRIPPWSACGRDPPLAPSRRRSAAAARTGAGTPRRAEPAQFRRIHHSSEWAHAEAFERGNQFGARSATKAAEWKCRATREAGGSHDLNNIAALRGTGHNT